MTRCRTDFFVYIVYVESLHVDDVSQTSESTRRITDQLAKKTNKRKQGGETWKSRRFSRGHISTAPRDRLEVDGARETKRNVQVRPTEATGRGTQRLENVAL